jgi:osmotically inducible lipoprotein OsmB
MRIAAIILSLAAASLLAGCGETRTQRVVTGAAAGAVAGEVIAGEPVVGGILGAGVGAVR